MDPSSSRPMWFWSTIAYIRHRWETLGMTHQHFKGEYYRAHHRTARAASLIPDQTEVTIYESCDGQLWVRPTDEFDGLVLRRETQFRPVRRFRPL